MFNDKTWQCQYQKCIDREIERRSHPNNPDGTVRRPHGNYGQRSERAAEKHFRKFHQEYEEVTQSCILAFLTLKLQGRCSRELVDCCRRRRWWFWWLPRLVDGQRLLLGPRQRI